MKCGLVMMMAAVLGIAAGCGDKDGGGSGGSSSPVVGKWTLDTAAVIKAMEAEAKKQSGENAQMMATMMPMMKKMAEGIKVDVDIKNGGDYTGLMSMPAMPGTEAKATSVKGTWKLTGEDLEMTSVEEDGKKKDPPETQRFKLRNGLIEMQIPDGPMLVLKRA